MSEGVAQFPIERDKVTRYIFWSQVLGMALVGVMLCGFGLVLVPLYLVVFGTWLPRKQAWALKYWLDGTTLRVDSGVIFLSQKGIPLDRVTDVVLVQGPLMRAIGIWGLRIQTAGMGAQRAEATLWGLREPEQVRDTLLRARAAAARGDRSGYGA